MCRRLLELTVTLVVLALGGCGESDRTIVLADFDVKQVREDPWLGPARIEPRGLHHFAEGWRTPEPEGIWTTDRPARVLFEVEGHEAQLVLRLKTHPSLAARGQTCSLYWNQTLLATRELPGDWQPDTLRVEIPDAHFGAGTGVLRLESTRWLGPEDGFAEPRGLFVQSIKLSANLNRSEIGRWRELVRPRPHQQHRSTRAIDSSTDPAELPDVLMILVDAARADHLSAYGYPRATTPNIDRLTHEGVRFDRVFATAPYTRSSVATLFSALSWRDHGVLTTGDALDDGHFTLAEALRYAGYWTVGISDNAQVGINAGSNQGFDEFEEAWNYEPESRATRDGAWWPEAPVEIFERRAAREFPAERPVFFYLHLLPPHEPYWPTAAHDLFGDPGYSGDITGITRDIVAFDQGRRAPSGPDRQRLVSLYDGALHRADALVQRAIEAWRLNSRERPTLIVLLSDHGEAFGEHARFGHNSTPFDEMLHVPFILWPRQLVPDAVAQGRDSFRSLADVYPLLLKTLGVGLPASAELPPSFFEVYDNPARDLKEIFVRCSVPVFARRTPTSLAIYRESATQSLFELVNDPDAEHDVRERSGPAWRAEWQRLHSFLRARTPGDPAESRLSPEDIERLKALGYM